MNRRDEEGRERCGAGGAAADGLAEALSRLSFLRGTLAAGGETGPQRPGEFFEWQFPTADKEKEWKRYSFNRERYEKGFAAEAPHGPISSFADCIFFDGLTRRRGRRWLHSGGRECYTCLATSPAPRKERRER